ncbi:MAG: sulfotransferase, partial [Deltaproteobacteria bacterium]|nr:sulfotransferase [Deltaproteobacteria bacterium]
YLAAKPRARHGAHQYEFADTGLDIDQERERFRPYYERYQVINEV